MRKEFCIAAPKVDRPDNANDLAAEGCIVASEPKTLEGWIDFAEENGSALIGIGYECDANYTNVHTAAQFQQLADEMTRFTGQGPRAAFTGSAWQPIETAPHDGSLILVWVYDEVRIVKWGKKYGYEYWCNRDDEILVNLWKYEGGVPDDWQLPTHWMPLPQEPKQNE